MDRELLFKLQNGSDIRGIAAEGINGERVNLTSFIIKELSGAFVYWLTEKYQCSPDKLTIAVGMDSRITGPVLKEAFIEGVVLNGARALDCGMASTPAMFMATILDGIACNASAMLTASHLPFNRNGLKFFTRDGGLEKEDITRILQITADGLPKKAVVKGEIKCLDLIPRYSDYLLNYIKRSINDQTHYDTPLQGFHIVVDAGNGAGSFYAEKVLRPLGADISGSQFLEPDGMFPNHVPNPEDKMAMDSIIEAVRIHKADMGIIFDTDVDRAAIVDHTGTGINRNLLIALISVIVLDEHPGSVIVTDSITSEGLHNFIEKELKGVHHRFKRGYKNVINEAQRLNKEGVESWLAIETSGHAALKENYFQDDGAYLVTKILVKFAKLCQQGKSLADLTSHLRIPAESREFRLKIKTGDFCEYGNKVIKELEEFVTTIVGWEIVPENYEGIRVICGKGVGEGWYLLRLSLHDPVMPLNIESDIPGGINLIASKLGKFFNKYQYLSAFEY